MSRTEHLSPYWAEIIMFLRDERRDNLLSRDSTAEDRAWRNVVIEWLIERAERRAGLKPEDGK